MPSPRIVFLNGASGAGKTATAKILSEAPDTGWLHPDGLWDTPNMDQETLTLRCVQRALTYSTPRVLIDSQLRHRFMETALSRYNVENGMQILLDCSDDVRSQRLRMRGSRQEFIDTMVQWAAFLRNDAATNGVAIIDTTSDEVSAVADSVSRLIEAGI